MEEYAIRKHEQMEMNRINDDFDGCSMSPNGPNGLWHPRNPNNSHFFKLQNQHRNLKRILIFIFWLDALPVDLVKQDDVGEQVKTLDDGGLDLFDDFWGY